MKIGFPRLGVGGPVCGTMCRQPYPELLEDHPVSNDTFIYFAFYQGTLALCLFLFQSPDCKDMIERMLKERWEGAEHHQVSNKGFILLLISFPRDI